jgi:hypothetical protein
MRNQLLVFVGAAIVGATLFTPSGDAQAMSRDYACKRGNYWDPYWWQCDIVDDGLLMKSFRSSSNTPVTLYATVNIQASAAWADVDACKVYRNVGGATCSTPSRFDYNTGGAGLGVKFLQVNTATWMDDTTNFAYVRVHYSHTDRNLVRLHGLLEQDY